MKGLKKIKVLAVGLILVLSLAGCNGKAAMNKSAENTTDIALNFVDCLVEGNYRDAVSMFDENMKKEITETDLSGVWELLQQQVGPYISTISNRTEKVEGHDIVSVTSEFEQALIDIRVVIDQKREIAGLFIEQAQVNK